MLFRPISCVAVVAVLMATSAYSKNKGKDMRPFVRGGPVMGVTAETPDIQITVARERFTKNEPVVCTVKNVSGKKVYLRMALHNALSHEGTVYFHDDTKKFIVETHDTSAAMVDKAERYPMVKGLEVGETFEVTWTGMSYPAEGSGVRVPGTYSLRVIYAFKASMPEHATQTLLPPALVSMESPRFRIE